MADGIRGYDIDERIEISKWRRSIAISEITFLYGCGNGSSQNIINKRRSINCRSVNNRTWHWSWTKSILQQAHDSFRFPHESTYCVGLENATVDPTEFSNALNWRLSSALGAFSALIWNDFRTRPPTVLRARSRHRPAASCGSGRSTHGSELERSIIIITYREPVV